MRLLFELFGYTSLQLIHQSAFVYISIVIYVHCTAVTLEILFSYHFWCCVGVLGIFCSVQLNLAYSLVQLKSKANILWQLSCARMNCVQNNNKKTHRGLSTRSYKWCLFILSGSLGHCVQSTWATVSGLQTIYEKLYIECVNCVTSCDYVVMTYSADFLQGGMMPLQMVKCTAKEYFALVQV